MEFFYERTQRMLGAEAIACLKSSHVVVLGVGGVGSWACEALVRTGIGELTLVDFDCIEMSNLNRQLHALQSTIGRPKVEVMEERLLNINPALKVHSYMTKITATTIPNFLASGDMTIDCIDDVQAKVAVIEWHLQHNKKIISSMGTGNKMGAQPFKIADISKTAVCPLARAVRLKLRKKGIYKGVPVLFSEELPYRKHSGEEKPGTVCFAPAMAGLALAQYVVCEQIKL